MSTLYFFKNYKIHFKKQQKIAYFFDCFCTKKRKKKTLYNKKCENLFFLFLRLAKQSKTISV